MRTENHYKQHVLLKNAVEEAGYDLGVATSARADADHLHGVYQTPKTRETAFQAFVAERDAANDLYFAKATLAGFESDHGDFAAEYAAKEREVQEMEAAWASA